jgi:hypothetical protein
VYGKLQFGKGDGPDVEGGYAATRNPNREFMTYVYYLIDYSLFIRTVASLAAMTPTIHGSPKPTSPTSQRQEKKGFPSSTELPSSTDSITDHVPQKPKPPHVLVVVLCRQLVK